MPVFKANGRLREHAERGRNVLIGWCRPVGRAAVVRRNIGGSRGLPHNGRARQAFHTARSLERQGTFTAKGLSFSTTQTEMNLAGTVPMFFGLCTLPASTCMASPALTRTGAAP